MERRTNTQVKAFRKQKSSLAKIMICARKGCLRFKAALKLWYLRRTKKYQSKDKIGAR